MAATKEQYEKILGRKLTDAEWGQIGALHPAAPQHSVAPLAELSTTPGAPGVTAYRMGQEARALTADQLARYRKFYTVPAGSDGTHEALGYLGSGAPSPAAPAEAPAAAPAPVVMRGGPAATPEQQALAAAHSPGGMVRPPLTAVQDPGNMEPYEEPVTYPLVKPAAQPAPIQKPGFVKMAPVKPPLVTLAPIEETVVVPKKKDKKKDGAPPVSFKMPMLGDAPDESPIPPQPVKG